MTLPQHFFPRWNYLRIFGRSSFFKFRNDIDRDDLCSAKQFFMYLLFWLLVMAGMLVRTSPHFPNAFKCAFLLGVSGALSTFNLICLAFPPMKGALTVLMDSMLLGYFAACLRVRTIVYLVHSHFFYTQTL